MSKKVSAAEASIHFSELLEEVREEQTTFVIVREDNEVGQLAALLIAATTFLGVRPLLDERT